MSYHFRNNLGFTLLELLVTISIVGVILTVVLMNQSSYTNDAALSNLADEIGLTISQAQAYGIGVKEFTPGSDDFNVAYGLSFNIGTTGPNPGSTTKYLYFADRDPDGPLLPLLPNKFYDGDWSSCPTGGANECINLTSISRGNFIYDICIIPASGNEQCNSSVKRVDISFARPKTEAQIGFFNSGGSQVGQPLTDIGAKVILKSPRGSKKSVTVYTTGQISIQSVP